MSWTDFLGTLSPLLSWITGSVALIGGIVLIWTIYENWSTNPERFSWFEAIFKALGIGLLGLMALRARDIVNSLVPGSYGSLPALNPMLREPYNWLVRGVSLFGGLALVWIIYQRWIQNPERFSWLQATYLAVGVIVVALIASRAEAILNAII